MLLVIAVIGLAAGWLVNMLTDYLPRFAADLSVTTWRWDALWIGVEVLCLIAALVFWTFSGDWLLLLGCFAFLLLVAAIDLKYRLILNILMYPAIVLAILVNLFVLRHDLRFIVLGGVFAFGIFYLTARLKPGQLGGGDVKLAALIGFTFGFPGVLWALITGVGVGALVSLVLLTSRRGTLKTTIPYAPFLCLGAMIILLVNPPI